MSSNKKIVTRFITALFSIVLLIAFFVIVTNQGAMADRSMYTGKEDHVITLPKAAVLTQNFQKSAKENELVAGFFGRDIYDRILAQKNCVGIRVYNASLDDGSRTLVLVGVDGNGNDLVNGVVGEDIMPCPPFCGHGVLAGSGEKGKEVALNK